MSRCYDPTDKDYNSAFILRVYRIDYFIKLYTSNKCNFWAKGFSLSRFDPILWVICFTLCIFWDSQYCTVWHRFDIELFSSFFLLSLVDSSAVFCSCINSWRNFNVLTITGNIRCRKQPYRKEKVRINQNSWVNIIVLSNWGILYIFLVHV